MNKNQENDAASLSQKGLNYANILGVKVHSTQITQLIRKISRRIEKRQKTVIVTPNPEFVVYAQKNASFKRQLNSADLAVADGIGLVWAARFLGFRLLKERITGVDLAEALLKLAAANHYRVGIIGARRGDSQETQKLLKNLKKNYGIKYLKDLEKTPGWQKRHWDLVFACQGMVRQEAWIFRHLKKSQATVYLGVGGGLDFLAGLVPRAPRWVRGLGLEWAYRLFRQPWRWRRQLNLACFVWMVLKEKLAQLSRKM